jgi:hypothetical protein
MHPTDGQEPWQLTPIVYSFKTSVGIPFEIRAKIADVKIAQYPD